MPPDDEGYKIMLTMVDVCSRWVIATPMQGQAPTAKAVAHHILDQWSKFGPAIQLKRVSHDGGSEMKALFTDVMHLLQVTRSVSAAGKPHGHGIVEKWNRNLAQITAKMCKSGSADASWRSIVPIACESTNVTI